jgi:transposase
MSLFNLDFKSCGSTHSATPAIITMNYLYGETGTFRRMATHLFQPDGPAFEIYPIFMSSSKLLPCASSYGVHYNVPQKLDQPISEVCRGLREHESMTMQRRQHRAEFKAKVALEAIRGERTINERAAESGVHPVQITQWKRVGLDELPQLFSSRRGARHKAEEALKAALYQQIGQFKVELDWLKKHVGHAC